MAKRTRVGDIAQTNTLSLDDPKTDFFAPTDNSGVNQPADTKDYNDMARYRPQTYLLSEEQIGALTLKCAITGRKKNELVREIFDEALAQYIAQYRELK